MTGSECKMYGRGDTGPSNQAFGKMTRKVGGGREHLNKTVQCYRHEQAVSHSRLVEKNCA